MFLNSKITCFILTQCGHSWDEFFPKISAFPVNENLLFQQS